MSSCIFLPQILKQTIHSIELCWHPIENCEVYRVEYHQKNLNPQKVYWGSQSKCLIIGLEENVCYKLQIHALKLIETGFSIIKSSHVFKANTLPNIPSCLSIYRAILKGQGNLLKRYILANTILMDTPGPNGLTPLGTAIIRGNKDIVDILATCKANINLACPITQRTPLQLSVFFGYISIAKLLIDYKANIWLKDKIGLDWIHYAIDGGHLDTIHFACEYTKNEVDCENRFQQNYLLRAVTMKSDEAVIILLINFGYDVKAVNSDKKSAIDISKFTGQDNITKLLLQHELTPLAVTV